MIESAWESVMLSPVSEQQLVEVTTLTLVSLQVGRSAIHLVIRNHSGSTGCPHSPHSANNRSSPSASNSMRTEPRATGDPQNGQVPSLDDEFDMGGQRGGTWSV